jgi:hypothetical protein
LREFYIALWDLGLIPGQSKDLNGDLKSWGRTCPNNDTKAKALVDLVDKIDDLIVLIDDVSGLTPTSRPYLEQLTEATTVVATVSPQALKKGGTKRFWKRFDELALERLSKQESEELLGKLLNRYRVVSDEPEIYKRRVLELSQGNPFELDRLVKYHSAEAIVKSRELGSYSQQFVERDVKQIALAPLLLIVGAFTIAARYIARAQGNLDLYVLSGIGVGLTIVFFPLLRKTLRPRSR